jgi:polysaccharide pyruvyl transferase WcaK-like protein
MAQEFEEVILFQQNNKQEIRQIATSVKNIGLMGPWGYENLGDAAIQEAMLQNISKYCPSAKIYGFSLIPEDTEKRHGIISFPISRVASKDKWWQGENPSSLIIGLTKVANKLKSIPNSLIRKIGLVLIATPLEILALMRAAKQLKDVELLIVSGGGQLDDYFGGAWEQPYTLFVWGILAKLSKTKFFFVSVGAGPINASLSKLFIKAALGLANYRSYRDEDSKKYIAKVVGFRKNDPVHPDLAHSLSVEQYQNKSAQTRSQLIIGINPMSYFDPRVWPEKNPSIYYGYLHKLATFVTWLIQKQYTILFFPGEVFGDVPVIKDLKTILNERGVISVEGQIIEEPIVSLNELMHQLSRTDLVIASRLHSILLSQLLNKPVLSISYHRKIDMLMKDRKQEGYCLPIDRFEVEELQEKFTALEANRKLIKQQLAKRTQDYKTALDKQYELLFKNL